jgi:hypothetical protein
MRVTIIGCIVLLLSVLTVSQWPYMGGYGGMGGGFLQVPTPTYSYQLPSSYSYTPAGVSLVGNTYTFTPPKSTFGAVETHNVNVTSPAYLNLPPFAFGGTGWNQGFGFGGAPGLGGMGMGGMGMGGIGGYNTMGFSPYGNNGYPGYAQPQYQPQPQYNSYSRYSAPPSRSRYNRGYSRGFR